MSKFMGFGFYEELCSGAVCDGYGWMDGLVTLTGRACSYL